MGGEPYLHPLIYYKFNVNIQNKIIVLSLVILQFMLKKNYVVKKKIESNTNENG